MEKLKRKTLSVSLPNLTMVILSSFSKWIFLYTLSVGLSVRMRAHPIDFAPAR
jgi:hypothetical protein